MASERPSLSPYNIKRTWHGIDASWMRRGACNVGLSPSEIARFFADNERGIEAKMDVLEARRFCWVCIVKKDCFDYAVAADMRGVWGGTTYKERKVHIRAKKAA